MVGGGCFQERNVSPKFAAEAPSKMACTVPCKAPRCSPSRRCLSIIVSHPHRIYKQNNFLHHLLTRGSPRLLAGVPEAEAFDPRLLYLAVCCIPPTPEFFFRAVIGLMRERRQLQHHRPQFSSLDRSWFAKKKP